MVSKADSLLEEMKDESSAPVPQAVGTPAVSQLDNIPSHISETYQGDTAGFMVDIDADVILPDAKIIPIAKVKPETFTQETSDKFISYFCGGEELYEMPQPYPYTKEEFNERIVYFKQLLNDPNSELNTYVKKNVSAQDYRASKEQIDDTIKSLEQQSMIAPEMREDIKANTTFKEDPERGIKIIEGTTLGPNPIHISISKNESNKNNNATFSKENNQFMEDGTVNVNDNTILRGTEVKLPEAQQEALQCLEDLGIESMHLSYVTTGFIVKENMPKDTWTQNYVFYFTRSLNHVSENYTKLQPLLENSLTSEFWRYEVIEIHVDDRGVTYFSWTSPSQQPDLVNENVQILPFSSVLDTLKKQLYYKGVWGDVHNPYEEDIVGRNVIITEMRLGLMRIAQVNNPSEYLLVPAWDFFGYEVVQYSEDSKTQMVLDENHKRDVKEYRNSFLTINAIDGSVIDRVKGY